MKMKNTKAFIFDFDGVIVDTESIHESIATEILLTKANLKINEKDKKDRLGIPDKAFYKLMSSRYFLNLDAEEANNLHQKTYEEKLKKISSPIKGIPELLEKIKGKGIRIGICSGTPREQIETILNNLKIRDYFETIVSSKDTSKHKPDPEPYLLTLKKMNINPKFCIAIEDTSNGVESAKRAGIYCLGFLFDPSQDISKADKIVTNLENLNP